MDGAWCVGYRHAVPTYSVDPCPGLVGARERGVYRIQGQCPDEPFSFSCVRSRRFFRGERGTPALLLQHQLAVWGGATHTRGCGHGQADTNTRVITTRMARMVTPCCMHRQSSSTSIQPFQCRLVCPPSQLSLPVGVRPPPTYGAAVITAATPLNCRPRPAPAPATSETDDDAIISDVWFWSLCCMLGSGHAYSDCSPHVC